MKSILTLSALFAFGGLSYGESEKCEKGHCDKNGAKSECSDGECCPDAKKLKLAITGLEEKENFDKAMTVLAKFKGAMAKKSCNGLAIQYKPETVTEADLISALTASGLTITEREMSLKISGMTCGGCATSVTRTLAKAEGVVGINKVCHASGHAVFTIDPNKTTPSKIAETINATKFKVAQATKEAKPQS